MKALLLLSFLLQSASFQQPFPLDEAKLTPQQKAALQQFKPGPRLKAELEQMEQAGRDLFAQYRDGQVDEATIHREKARRDLTGYGLRVWCLGRGVDEVLNIVVVQPGTSEIRQVFPHGTAHLPEQLRPGDVYHAAPGDGRRWQFMGKAKLGDYTFVVFRLIEWACERGDDHIQALA